MSSLVHWDVDEEHNPNENYTKKDARIETWNMNLNLELILMLELDDIKSVY